MRVHLLFLGPARDFAGVEATSLEVVSGTTLAALRQELLRRFPGLSGAISSIRLVVNEEFAPDDAVLESDDRVALLPPVSGGAEDPDIFIDLVTGPIDWDQVCDFVHGHPNLGGIVTFEGAVRAETSTEHGPLVQLEYEAYESMARRQLVRLATEAKSRWSVGRVAIVHRLGIVPIGEVSIVIAVACAHRSEAFEACRWLIEVIKRDVPIWKKDSFADGHRQWVQPPAPQNGGDSAR